MYIKTNKFGNENCEPLDNKLKCSKKLKISQDRYLLMEPDSYIRNKENIQVNDSTMVEMAHDDCIAQMKTRKKASKKNAQRINF